MPGERFRNTGRDMISSRKVVVKILKAFAIGWKVVVTPQLPLSLGSSVGSGELSEDSVEEHPPARLLSRKCMFPSL